MVSKIANIYVPELWKNEPRITVQKTADPALTDRRAENLTVPREDGEFLNDNNKLHLTHLDVLGMIDSTMLWYEDSTMTWLSDGMTRNTMETLLKSAAEEEMNGNLSHIY